jgi:hypothetical protein
VEDALNAWMFAKVVAAARSAAGSPAIPITPTTSLRELKLPPAKILQLIQVGEGSGDQDFTEAAAMVHTVGDLVGYLSARIFPDTPVADDDPKPCTRACNTFLVAPAPFDAGLLCLAY